MKAGIIKVQPQIILDFLQFGDGGSIRLVEYNVHTSTVDFFIEHPEMPEVKGSEPWPIVMPMYTTYQDPMGHRVTLREKLKI